MNTNVKIALYIISALITWAFFGFCWMLLFAFSGLLINILKDGCSWNGTLDKLHLLPTMSRVMIWAAAVGMLFFILDSIETSQQNQANLISAYNSNVDAYNRSLSQ